MDDIRPPNTNVPAAQAKLKALLIESFDEGYKQGCKDALESLGKTFENISKEHNKKTFSLKEVMTCCGIARESVDEVIDKIIEKDKQE